MKVLFITPNDINSINGGGINVKKLYLSLKSIEEIELKVYSPTEALKTDILSKKNKINDVLSRLAFHSNYMYIDWKFNKNKIIEYSPDVVILSNSRLGFIAKYLKNKWPNIKIITQLDNIELDYCENYVEKFKGIKKKLIKLIERKSVYRDEKKAFDYSDSIIFLTERDKKRAKTLYEYKVKKEYIIPICLEKKIELNKKSNKKLNFIFLGSLWYYPNYSGIEWFIKNVWKNIEYDNFQLIIAGSKPSETIKAYNGKDNIVVYPNFKSVEEIIPENSVFISPILEGAGMKVKIAEALSMGLPVIATEESLIGYDEAINKGENKCIYKANTNIEFINKIKEIVRDYSQIKMKNISNMIFEEYYYIDRCKDEISKILEINLSKEQR
ncbi:glycosyltransferase [Clostridium thermobutyricum]|uniref:Glycosyl transferases group 1 n=1 Tax=Clostridium thermobutyricum DSM 4928 TaxID=1121339 RepID=A0A1V4SW75_9CLOT|nr:glycosyltransferase [Clostridium thermobutyricum]OPX47474.1 glycosyl transferases group 1 [Clostridium thermobutyricum DSM 4928]